MSSEYTLLSYIYDALANSLWEIIFLHKYTGNVPEMRLFSGISWRISQRS
jgi:hypothetical protein